MIAVGQCTDAAIDGLHIVLFVEKVSKLCRKAELFHSPNCRGIAKECVKVAALLQFIAIMYEREGEVYMADGSGGRYALAPIK